MSFIRGKIRYCMRVILPLYFEIGITIFSMVVAEIKERSWSIVILMVALPDGTIEVEILMPSVYSQGVVLFL